MKKIKDQVVINPFILKQEQKEYPEIYAVLEHLDNLEKNYKDKEFLFVKNESFKIYKVEKYYARIGVGENAHFHCYLWVYIDKYRYFVVHLTQELKTITSKQWMINFSYLIKDYGVKLVSSIKFKPAHD